MAPRVHISGASGCGVSTLGAALAGALGVAWHDTDDFYWPKTDPPYQVPRPVEARLALLGEALDDAAGWVLSGALDGWGDPLIGRWGFEIFLSVPMDIRMARLRARERARFGAMLDPGGVMHDNHVFFMDWAAAYDSGGPDMRSRGRHEAWLAAMPCPVLRLDGTRPTGEMVAECLAALKV